MGDMADQYNDGRYDSRDEYGHVVLPDEHGFAHTSIGYVPITARRGGIKYPKGTPVTKSLEQQLTDLKRQHKATHENLGYLAERIAELDKKVKAQRKAPPLTQRAWTIDVRFTRGGGLYTYLILRHGEKFYTTGTNVQDSVLDGWHGMLGWLDSVHEHSALIPMRADYDVPAPLEGRRGA